MSYTLRTINKKEIITDPSPTATVRTAVEKAVEAGKSLEGVYLRKANLARISLAGINLSHANLTSAILDGAILEGANLERSILVCTRLRGARLKNANLTRAILIKANLFFALLRNANLEHAILQEANLAKASLVDSNLSSAVLDSANITGTKLWGAKLTGVHLEKAGTGKIRNEFGTIVWEHPQEAEKLRLLLLSGKLNGYVYARKLHIALKSGDTIIGARPASYQDIPINDLGAAEIFIHGIKHGDTAANSPIAALLVTWIEELKNEQEQTAVLPALQLSDPSVLVALASKHSIAGSPNVSPAMGEPISSAAAYEEPPTDYEPPFGLGFGQFVTEGAHSSEE